MPHILRSVVCTAVFAVAGMSALGQSASTMPAGYKPPPLPPEVTFAFNKTIKITDAGALADGKTLINDAVKKAIDECAAAGGGIVQFPKVDGKPTEYLSGAI